MLIQTLVTLKTTQQWCITGGGRIKGIHPLPHRLYMYNMYKCPNLLDKIISPPPRQKPKYTTDRTYYVLSTYVIITKFTINV